MLHSPFALLLIHHSSAWLSKSSSSMCFVSYPHSIFLFVLHAVLFLSCPVPHFVFPSLVSFHSPLPSIKASQLSGHLVTLRYTTWNPASRCPLTWRVSVGSPPRCCWTSPTLPASTKTPPRSSAHGAMKRNIATLPPPGTSRPVMKRKQMVRDTTAMNRRTLEPHLEPLRTRPLTCVCLTAWTR